MGAEAISPTVAAWIVLAVVAARQDLRTDDPGEVADWISEVLPTPLRASIGTRLVGIVAAVIGGEPPTEEVPRRTVQ